MFFKSTMIAGAIGVLLLGCASSPKVIAADSARGDAITAQAGKEVDAYNFVEVAFDRGSSALSASAKDSLRAVVNQAGSAGQIDEVIVLSWADEAYPSKSRKVLSNPQVDLAANRNSNVKDFLTELSAVSDVDTYNMAKQPNSVAKLLKTTDARLKNALVAAGLPTTADETQYPSKTSRAVILIKLN